MKKEIVTNSDYNFTVALFVSDDGFCHCPVCGSKSKNRDWRPYGLNGTPSYDICDCNFQFGYDDGDFPGPYDKTWENYREKWLKGQIKNERTPRLTLSQKREQLRNIGIESNVGLSKKEKRKLTKPKKP
ncbi:hypothetical protein O3Q51_18270 [Cryomorphaceae bacterium 1068]|nr:hypothetical protein [Cryomorphaceae bacterium 1068]